MRRISSRRVQIVWSVVSDFFQHIYHINIKFIRWLALHQTAAVGIIGPKHEIALP